MSQAADRIESTLNIRDVMEFYGIQFNRHGYAACPFHNEKTPSLHIKNGRFTCYGCGAYGRVIDFVERYFNLTFGQAITRLNADFNLGLTNERPTAKSIAMARKKAQERQAELARRTLRKKAYLYICEKHADAMRNGEDTDELERWLDNNTEMAVTR